MRLVLRLLPALALATLTAPVPAQRAHLPTDSEPAGRPVFDVRHDGDLVSESVREAIAASRDAATTAARAADLNALRDEIVELRLDEDEFFGTPHFLRSTRQMLTRPADGAFTPVGVVSGFVDTWKGLFEVSGDDVLATQLKRDLLTRHNGVTHLTLQQQALGLDILGLELKASVTAEGALVNISSTLLPVPTDGFDVPGVGLAAIDAVRLAAADVGIAVSTAPAPAGRAEGTSQLQSWQPNPSFRADTPVTTELLLFPLDRATIHPAWLVVIPEHGVGNTYEIVVDATDGSILKRKNRLRHYAGGTQTATFNIFPLDGPAPGSPGNPTPNGNQFPFINRTMITLGATSGSPEGWIPDGVNEPNGNNCDAHLDLNADNSPDLPRPQGSPFRVFDFPFDPAQQPSTYRDAAVTQIFYYMNNIHDRLYDYGFDEAAGNFQMDNFGLGGSGDDAISADAQDGSSTNNANWNGSGTDGTFTWIQMYIFDDPTPMRDGDFSGDVSYHEYCHGLSIRLSGGTVSGEQSGGMGEGWGDYFGICMSAEAGDDPDGVYAAGGYLTKDFAGTTENYYWGIRRYPYSTDMSKSPLTYADADPGQFVAPGGIPANGLFIGNPADEVHNVGELWCQVLLECRAQLWSGMGFAANDLLMQLVVDGLKLMPSNPNMLEARDAILNADLINNGGSNLGQLWAGFAKRGMGGSAISPSGSTTTGIVEAFDVPTLIVFDFPVGQPSQLMPGVTTNFQVNATGLAGTVLFPNTGTLHYEINGEPTVDVPMTPTGVDEYSASLPALACFDEIDYWVSVDSTGGLGSSPSTAPTQVYEGTAFTSVTTLLTDELEVASGWTVGHPSDDATTGVWVLGDPNGTSAQSEDDHTPSGTECFFTGQGSPGGSVGENDVDAGTTTLTSPQLDLSSGDALIGYWRWYNNVAGGSPNADVLVVEITDDGTNWVVAETVGPTGDDTGGGWVYHEFPASDFVTPTANVQLRFRASDLGSGSIVEAAVDDLQVTRLECGLTCQVDLGGAGHGSLVLSSCGQPLSTGNSSLLALDAANPGGFFYLVLAFNQGSVAFAGGTLVPFPWDALVAFTADASGHFELLLPGGTGPASIYIQAVEVDGAQPQGFALSNALRLDFLP
jgi:hypothetical protein